MLLRDVFHFGYVFDVQLHGGEADELGQYCPDSVLPSQLYMSSELRCALSRIRNWFAGTQARPAWPMWPRLAPCLSCLRAMPPSAAWSGAISPMQRSSAAALLSWPSACPRRTPPSEPPPCLCLPPLEARMETS